MNFPFSYQSIQNRTVKRTTCLRVLANPKLPELWRELTQLEVGSDQVSWGDVLVEGELMPVLSAWEKLVTEKHSVTIQTQVRRAWKAPELDRQGKEQIIDTHILLSLYPDLDEYGEVTTVMSCITDITSLKWSESQLRRRMDQAIEMKTQQERFIDMTSFVSSLLQL
jgi:hypothetical protein